MARRIRKKRKVLVKRMRRHLLILVWLFTAGFAAVIGAVIYYNVVEGDKYSQKVLSQKGYESVSVPFKRGDIYDRNGSILATSAKVYNLVIEPKNIIEFDYKQEATEKALNKYFNISDQELKEYLADEQSQYKVIRKKLTFDEVRAYQTDLRDGKLKNVVGIRLEDEYQRLYPNNELACHLLGFVVSGNEGIGGIEGSYNSFLNGQNGRTYSYLGEDYNLQRTVEQATDGYSLVTTIDSESQRIVQTKCEEFMEEMGAKNISVLVMNPKNCEILALYNSHQYNPNDAYSLDSTRYQFETDGPISDGEFDNIKKSLSDEEAVEHLDDVWRNFVISDSFEPGSTYKVFTVSGAIEDGVITGNEEFYCDGYQNVADWKIKCHNVYGHGMLTVPGALKSSCNDCLMQIASLEGADTFDKYQVLFGFGQKTNIDVSGEASEESLYSMVYHQDTLNPVELATSSFGQGVTVTMMQLGTAFCSVINGGYYYQPHVVKQVLDSDGNLVENYDKILVRRTISQETSDQMKEILKEVVEDGTGKKAIVEGYEIGGKTGTAEKLPRGNGKYILSFIGFAPVNDPEVVIYCVVDEPGADDQASSAAGTVLFNKIATELLPYMNIYRTGDATPSDAASEDEIATPVFEGNAPDISVAGSTPEQNAQPASPTDSGH